MMSHDQIIKIILQAIEQLNMSREPDQQLTVEPEAAIFGADSPLDSLGLVALVIDIEEALADEGAEVSLSDEKTMSQKQSPFRTVTTLAAFIEEKLAAPHES